MDTKIEEVEQEIRKVQQQIDGVEEKLTKGPEAEVAYWRDKEKQLRDKEKQLREDKRQLREEKLLLLKADTSVGEPPPKKTQRSPAEYQSSYAVDAAESKAAVTSFYGKLLEAPPELPESTRDLQRFLSSTTVELPLLEETYAGLVQTDFVKRCTSAGEVPLAAFLYSAYVAMKTPSMNEATSSHKLCFLTGDFLEHLNTHAPAGKHIGDLFCILDSANSGTSKSETSSLRLPLRPDFQLFVGGVLMLRWENKIEREGLLEAVEENKTKLKVWSHLYYGKLPYVIGGCCGGTTFRWLKLFPNGEQIGADFISEPYNWYTPLGMARFLHSVIRMHCLLKRLEVELGNHVPVSLYVLNRRTGTGEFRIYPDHVRKVLKPPLEKEELGMFKSLYASIKGSRYLIQLKAIYTTEHETQLLLEPVGYPQAIPGVSKDLKDAVHDILHGLKDLHEQGYTHRDLRWANVIKVNVLSGWKWVIIDLEAAGPDGEEWDRALLKDWDEGTLVTTSGAKKIYTKESDIYQLGKLVVEWFGGHSLCDEEGRLLYELGVKMHEQRPAASTILGEICKLDCERCGKLAKFRTS